MDVNGTRFHLIAGKDDWLECLKETSPYGSADATWVDQCRALTLQPQLSFFFPRGLRDIPLQPSARRGAAFDRFGNRYWIGRDRHTLYWIPSGSGGPVIYWLQGRTDRPAQPGMFRPTNAQPAAVELAGLAVTEHHYLVVGNVTQHGLFVFDLHAGGEPLLLLLPETFTPFDLATAPGGGVWALDRDHRTYWGVDRDFRVLVEPDTISGARWAFHDIGPGDLVACSPGEESLGGGPSPAQRTPQGFPVAAPKPVSIVALPDQSVLILHSPDDPAAGSTLYHDRLGRQVTPPQALPSLAGLVADGQDRPVNGHDMAYIASTSTLYVVERDGLQAIAFQIDVALSSSPLQPLTMRPDYLPMQAYGSRGLVVWNDKVFYDVGDSRPSDGLEPIGPDTIIRWVELQVIDEPRYVRTATVFLPVLDGKDRNCVWHRLFLDACIPSETTVEVWTRAGNDSQLLDSSPFFPEPPLYLRSGGSELPYYQPFPEVAQPSENTGTWELLFQQAQGRYLQIKLVLSGNGRATPRLRALRAYYPRFSYSRRYLPAVYLEDVESASFLERLLANPEGFYTEIEGKIAAVSTLFDARTAPLETLDWLAGWLGLMLDPLWSNLPAQQSTRGTAPALRRFPDRRRLFIRFVLRLYNRRGTPEGIQFALHLLLDPCLERLLDRLRMATLKDDPVLRAELARLELSYPTPVMSEADLEDLVYQYVLSPARPSKVRLVERFQTRQGQAAVAGDPTGTSTGIIVQDAAHRFSVLVPEGLSSAEEAMVQRIVQLEKPAHTSFDVRHYWDAFRVGEARLGLDTIFGEESRFQPIVLGRDYLAEGYLSPSPPMDVADRLITDRDLLGQRPL